MKKSTIGLLLLFISLNHLYALDTPVPLTPLNNSGGYMRNPGFTWNAIPGANSYQIEIATDAGFENIIRSRSGLPVPRYVPVAALPDTFATLYWHVKAVTATESSDWSTPFTYHLSPPQNLYFVPDNASFTEVKSILDDAAKHTPALVKFASKGSYALDPGPVRFMFAYTGVNDLIIDGNGSEITICNHLETGFMSFTNANRITVKGFTVDWDPLPHSLLDVIAVNNADSNTLDIRVRLRKVAGKTSPYYPDIASDSGFIRHWSWTYLLDKARPGAVKPGTLNAFGIASGDVKSRSSTDPPEYEIKHPGSKSGKYFSPGDILAVLCRLNMGSFITTTGCTDLTFDGIINYASPMGCYYSFDGSDMKVLNCRSALKDTTRFITANADGVHCRSNTTGPWVENCSFIGNGDDGVALYNKGMIIKSKNSTTSLTVLSEFMNLRSNDVFDIYIPKTGGVISQGFKIQAAPVNNGNGSYTIQFSPAIADSSYAALTDVGNPDGQQNAQLFNATRRNEKFFIYNNLFTVRGRGIIIRSAQGAVDSNRLYNCSSPAVAFYNEASLWYNGLYSRNIQVLRNDIRDCSYDNLGLDEGAITIKFKKIYLQGSRYADGISPFRPHSGILVSGNTIRNLAQHGITLFNATGSKVTGNAFTSTKSSFPQPGNHYGIYLHTTDSCTIGQNNFSGETRPLTAITQKVNSTNVIVIP